MIEEIYLRQEKLPLNMWFETWMYKTKREKQLEEIKKKYNNINKDKL